MEDVGSDRQGRAIPDASWPAGKTAPGRLERVRRFLNTANLESGADHLADLHGALVWLGENGWGRHLADLDDGALARLVHVREQLRDLLVARSDESRTVAWEVLVGDLELRVVAGADGLRLGGSGCGTAAIVGELVAIAVESELRGDWSRLTACGNPSCRWVVYDRTKGRSNVWCSMSACGQRHKQRNYRLRQARSTAPR
jgi:predicted RNA-binding Zn ribbon-like protein